MATDAVLNMAAQHWLSKYEEQQNMLPVLTVYLWCEHCGTLIRTTREHCQPAEVDQYGVCNECCYQ